MDRSVEEDRKKEEGGPGGGVFKATSGRYGKVLKFITVLQLSLKDDSPLPPRLFFHLFQIQQIITINTTTNKTRQSINNGSISSCDWSVFASASTSEIILFTNFQTFLLI